MNDELYGLLGVEKGASKAEVKRAYRGLAKVHHPDAGGDAETFRMITLAYDVLMDDERRARYDATGEADEVRQDNPNAAIYAVLSGMLDEVLMRYTHAGKDPAKIDLVKVMKDLLREQKDMVKAQKKAIRNREKWYARIAGRFSRKDGEESVFESIIRSRIASVAAEIEGADRESAMIDRLLEVVSAHDFRFDEMTADEKSAEIMARFAQAMGGTKFEFKLR